MPADLQRIDKHTSLRRLSGTVLRTEFDSVQDPIAGHIDRGVNPRIRSSLENFEGWDQSLACGNLDFRYWQSNDIAMVDEPRWEGEALTFAGAGSHNAPVRFFPKSQLEEARAWLAQ